MFPNRHSVYLHDTPKRSLFKKPQRAYSSGCVRVERPLELAEMLLDDPKWNQSRFESVLRSKRPATVRLKQPFPVILSYWTAEADEHGRVHFREDIYGRDTAVLAALNDGGPIRVVYDEDSVRERTVAVVPEREREIAAFAEREEQTSSVPKQRKESASVPERPNEVVSVPKRKQASDALPEQRKEIVAVPGRNKESISAPERIAEAMPKPQPTKARSYGTDLPGEGPLFSF
jgi:hypothetical protein